MPRRATFHEHAVQYPVSNGFVSRGPVSRWTRSIRHAWRGFAPQIWLALGGCSLLACASSNTLSPDAAIAPATEAVAPSSESFSQSSLLQVAARTNPGGWRLLPDSLDPEFDDLLPSGMRRLMSDGIRALDMPDGSVQIAKRSFRSVAIRATDLPPRLGGGVLFNSDGGSGSSIWWARDWLADPESIASISEHIESISIGFDRLYFRATGSRELLALDLRGKNLTDLGPLPPSSGYAALLFVDEWFGAVYSDVIGMQATFDGGATWHALNVKAADVTLTERDGEIVITSPRGDLVLTRDGKQREFGVARDVATTGQAADARFALDGRRAPNRSYVLPLGPRPLREAVLYGWPHAATEAVVASHGNLARVHLDDGKILELSEHAYQGHAACPAVGLGSGFGFVCSDAEQGTRIYAFAAPLELTLIAQFESVRHVTSSGNGKLVVSGSCNSDTTTVSSNAGPSQTSARYCIFDSNTQHRELEIPGFDAEQRVVALADGALAIIHPPTRTEAARLRLVEGEKISESLLALKAPDPTLRKLLTHGTWLDGMTEVQPRVLGGWVAGTSYVGVHVDMQGKVETPSVTDQEYGDVERTLLNGPFGFEVSASGVAWQTANYGFLWRKLGAPRSLDPFFTTDPRVKLGIPPTLGCSAVGCVYEPWVRVGYQNDEDSGGKGLQQVEVPEALSNSTPGYEDWRLNCYPTGERQALDAAFRRELNELESARPKQGSETGYSAVPLRAPNAQTITNAAFRPFLGVPSPKRSAQGWLFDMGHDRPGEFRAYAWGERGSAWRQSGAWLVRVATRFGPKPFWSTAPTRAPWPEWFGAQLFGADTSSQSLSDWSVILDPDESSGVLRIASQRGSAELHWIEDGRTINSIAASDLNRPTSVVRNNGGVLLGVVEANRFRVYRMTQRELQEVASFPINGDGGAKLVRSNDASRVAVWSRDEQGTWYLYPLLADFTAQAPLVVKREQLNHTAPMCSPDTEGWLVRARPPLNRAQAEDLDLLTLSTTGARAGDLEAKVLVTAAGVCLLELAATLTSAPRQDPSGPQPPPSATIPLTVRDYGRDDQLRFRCEPASAQTPRKWPN